MGRLSWTFYLHYSYSNHETYKLFELQDLLKHSRADHSVSLFAFSILLLFRVKIPWWYKLIYSHLIRLTCLTLQKLDLLIEWRANLGKDSCSPWGIHCDTLAMLILHRDVWFSHIFPVIHPTPVWKLHIGMILGALVDAGEKKQSSQCCSQKQQAMFLVEARTGWSSSTTFGISCCLFRLCHRALSWAMKRDRPQNFLV